MGGKYRYGYQGQFAEKDDETGWNHFELREFDPVIGRWLVVDPEREFWSSYEGIGNNPISGLDPNGGDVIILNAPQGASGYGHAAILVGNDKTGWKYISKDGTDQFGGTTGARNESTINAVRSQIFPTLQDFLLSDFNKDKEHSGVSEYHFGLQIETDEATDARIIEAATQGAMDPYDVLSSNCIQNCTRPLVREGILPSRFAGIIRPNKTFDAAINFINEFETQILQGYHSWESFILTKEKLRSGKIEPGKPIMIDAEFAD